MAAITAPPPQKGRAKPKVPEATAVAGKLWEVEVLDTVIFPEGEVMWYVS
jgi:hypothetical protein